MVENLFDCLCSALMLPDNQTAFLKAEGVELMVLTLRENRYAARCALKTLDFAIARNTVCCERFVDVRGLATLFPYVGGPAKLVLQHVKSKQERSTLEKDDEEHIASIVCTLFHELDGAYRQRLLSKFVEGGHVRVDHIVRLRRKYVDKVEAFEERFRAEGGDEDDDEDELFLGRLDAGEYIIQLSTAILGYLIVSGDAALSKRVLTALHADDVPFGDVVETLSKLKESMGDEQGGTTVTNNALKVQALHARVDALYQRMKRT